MFRIKFYTCLISKRQITTYNKPFKVSIEGNIACGKSTLLSYFNNKYTNIKITPEPINEWRNVNGNNLFELLYKDIKRWNFTFENLVQLTRLKIQTLKTKENIHMFERSLQNNRYCFVEMSYKSNLLTGAEYAVLSEWYKWIEKNIDISLDLIVYLKCDPEIAFERIKLRKRPEERNIQLDYIIDLHNSYEEWLIKSNINKTPLLILDANKSLLDLSSEYKYLEEHLFKKKQMIQK